MSLKSRTRILCVSFLATWCLVVGLLLLGVQNKPRSLNQPKLSVPHNISWSKADFIATAKKSAVDDDFDHSHIKTLCDNQQWDDSVVFTCHGVIGGIGNIRQELLHCLRYAIDAGAGIITAVIHLRSENDLSNLENGTTSMDYLFDHGRFLSRLKSTCPQMPIYKDIEEVKKLGLTTQTESLDLKKLFHWPTMPIYSARAHVMRLKAPSGHISVIPFEKIWHYFPICHDPVGLADTLSSLIPFRQDVHILAAAILYELHARHKLPINPKSPTTLPFAATFMGIHLRTASDILPDWPRYIKQEKYYLTRIAQSEDLSSLPTIYIASGNLTSISDFRTAAQSLPQPKNVVTKYDLVSETDRSKLSSLTWDQQALVDELVLSRSAYFLGVADSSFSWTIAVGRRRTTEAGSCGSRSGIWKSRLQGAALRDEYSDLMGSHGYKWEDKMWP